MQQAYQEAFPHKLAQVACGSARTLSCPNCALLTVSSDCRCAQCNTCHLLSFAECKRNNLTLNRIVDFPALKRGGRSPTAFSGASHRFQRGKHPSYIPTKINSKNQIPNPKTNSIFSLPITLFYYDYSTRDVVFS